MFKLPMFEDCPKQIDNGDVSIRVPGQFFNCDESGRGEAFVLVRLNHAKQPFAFQNVVYFPLLVLKGIYHRGKYVFSQGGLSQCK